MYLTLNRQLKNQFLRNPIKPIKTKRKPYSGIIFFEIEKKILLLQRLKILSHGVTGNTTDFGSVESRFEP
jgi:hypothetical protein